MDKKKTVSFDLLRINNGMKKICTCNPPHHKQLREETNRLKRKVKVYSEEANKELKRMRKSRVFREMEESYRKNMLPRCPKCKEYFDPLEIIEFRNAKYIKQEEEGSE